MDKHAQFEIRQYAEVIYKIVQQWVPLTAEAFDDYVLNAVTFSKQELDILRAMVKGNPFSVKELTEREWGELTEKVKW